MTLGFVGVLGLLTPIWAPTPPASAGEQAAIPLSQALDQLETALTSLESAVPSQASPAAPSQPSAPASVASSAKDLIAEAQKLYERRLYGAAATLLGEQLARSTQLAQDPAALLLLGESLAELGDLRGAKSQLSTLIEKQPSNGRALLRLLAISTQLGSDPREKTWLAQLAALPTTTQPESAPYVRGKLLFLRGDAQGAIQTLATVSESNSYHYRARYIVGAAQVQLGKLESAEAVFQALIDKPLPRRDDDLRVVELCHMALGRLAHERGDTKRAHDSYLRISQKSNLFKDAIYEASWSALRAGDSERAEQSLKLLLIAYRDEPQTTLPVAEAKLLLGDLLLRRGEPDAAAEYFSSTRTELTPLLERLKTDLGSTATLSAKLRDQLGAVKAPLSLSDLAPQSLLSALAGDEVLTQLQAMDRELYTTRIALREQEALLDRVDKQRTPRRESPVEGNLAEPRNRSLALYRYLVAMHRASADRLDALLTTAATPEEKQQLDALAQRRDAIAKGLAEPRGGNDALDGTSSARRSHAELLGEAGSLYLHVLLRLAPPARAQADEQLTAINRITTIEKRLRDTIGRLDRLLDMRVGDQQSQLAAERDGLRSQREALDKLQSETAQVAAQATWTRLQQTTEQYKELLVHAEAGIAEVAWARRQKSSDELAQIQHDQQRELRMLDDAFASPEDNKASAKPASGPTTAVAPLSPSPKAPPTKAEDLPLPSDLPAELAADYRRYFEAARSHKQVLDEIGREGYKVRRSSLKADFAERLTREEAREKQLRGEAIVELERFLSRYPQHPRHSPEAMFRLAELLLERSSEDFIGQSKTQSGEMLALPDYNPSVDLYRRLLRDFPTYRNNHLATYLLGYCLGEMDHDEESRQAFLGLVCANKFAPLATPAPPVGRKNKPPYDGCEALKSDGKLTAETWTRLGEYHFDRGELDAAIFSYEQAVPFRDSPYFDKALYKLAWSFYRSDRFPFAVKHFDELVVLADQKKLGEPGKKEGFALRSESVQYLALSFAERDWDGDGKDDPVAGLARAELFYQGRQSEPHVREVFHRMGDVLFDRTEYARAAEVYRRTIALWPLAAENPRLQDRIVLTMERLRNFEQALREREQLARTYVEGSEWAKQNRDNEAALAEGLQLADLALMNVVLRRHESAQKLREQAQAKGDPKLRQQAVEEYRQAAASYEAYLTQHPNSKDRYEYSYYLAESLFFGEKYPEAAEAYDKVRDADAKGKYVEDAAYGAIKSREAVVTALYQQGPQKEPPLPQTGKVTAPVVAMQLPDEVQKLQYAYDRFGVLLPDSPKVALFSYKAAEIDFRYLRFAQMRLRMAEIVTKFCKDERAVDAGNALLVSYNIDGDLEKLEEWTVRLKDKGCGGSSQVAQTQQGSIKKLSQQVRFKKAEQLLAQKRFAEAATLFIELVGLDPRGPDADKALFNAAVAQESDRRYGAATETYERIVRDYPQSTLVDESLFRAAVNHQRFFEYDKAVEAYQKLGTEPRFKGSSHRHDALYNAALIAENDQRYALAADLWKQYAQSDKTNQEEAATAYFRAALSIEKLGPAARAVQELSQFVERYGSNGSFLPQVVEAYVRLARVEQKQGNPFDASEHWKRAAQLGQKLPPGSDAAEYAAEAAFLIAEQKLQEVERLKIGGSGKELEASINSFNKKVQETVVVYDKVLSYKRANHTLAAYFRMGYVFELYAKAFLAAPCPPEVRRLGAEACDLYKNKIEENVSGIEEKALQRYSVTLEQAQKLGVANQWTKLARQRANAYKPEVYPLTKDEHVAKQLILAGPLPAGDGSEVAKLAKEARSALHAGQYENAIVLGKLALSKDDRHVPTMLVLATSYYFLGKRELAAAIVGIAQTIDANSSEAYLILGFLSLAKDDRIAATAAFKRATELDPGSGLAWHNLSALYLLAKNYEQALFACERSTVLLPGLLATQLNYGSALRGMRRFVEADSAYKRVLSTEPQNGDAMFNLGILYLDAPAMPGFDPISQRMIAIRYLESYLDSAPRGSRDDSAEAYIKDARSAIEREQRRQKKKPSPSPEGAP